MHQSTQSPGHSVYKRRRVARPAVMAGRLGGIQEGYAPVEQTPLALAPSRRFQGLWRGGASGVVNHQCQLARRHGKEAVQRDHWRQTVSWVAHEVLQYASRVRAPDTLFIEQRTIALRAILLFYSSNYCQNVNRSLKLDREDALGSSSCHLKRCRTDEDPRPCGQASSPKNQPLQSRKATERRFDCLHTC